MHENPRLIKGPFIHLRFLLRFSPSDACERVDELRMFGVHVPSWKRLFHWLRVTKRNKATVLLTLPLLQTPTLTLTLT
jgi:hypothetical protein